MTFSISARLGACAVAASLITGCGSISGALGLERHVPDETQVVVRPQLTLPPDYDLTPPGTPSAVSGDHETEAEATGATPANPAPPKEEERSFIGSVFHDVVGGIFGSDSRQPQKPTSDETAPEDGKPGETKSPATP